MQDMSIDQAYGNYSEWSIHSQCCQPAESQFHEAGIANLWIWGFLVSLSLGRPHESSVSESDR